MNNKIEHLTMNKRITYFSKKQHTQDNLNNIISKRNPSKKSGNSIEKFFSQNSDTTSGPKLFTTKKIRRRDKEDEKRKKIKSKIHKFILNYLNKKLSKAGSKKFFESFGQYFISDITRETNHAVMELTYVQLFKYIRDKLNNDEIYRKKDYNESKFKVALKKDLKNQETLEYLESNPEISKLSDWDKIKNMKYSDLLKEFLASEEFLQSIKDLYENEENDYIDSFKYYTDTYVDFFLNYKPSNKNPSTNIKYQKRYTVKNYNKPNYEQKIIVDSNIQKSSHNNLDNNENLHLDNIFGFITRPSPIYQDRYYSEVNEPSINDSTDESSLILDEDNQFLRKIPFRKDKAIKYILDKII